MKKVKITVNDYNIKNMPENINIKLFGDLHYCEGYETEKFNAINEVLDRTKTEYICFTGDLIDYTNFLYNKNNQEELLKWLSYLGKKYKTIISLGNHDSFLKGKNGWEKDFRLNFWNDVSNIEGINLLHNNPYYEDDKLSVLGPNIPFEYYINETGRESKAILIDTLKKYKEYINKLPKDKLKILMLHSPYFASDKELAEYVKNFNFIFSGHMHNGMVLSIIDNIIKNNRGIIAPEGTLFPDNARGLKEMDIDGNNVNLIITGGVTKLANNSGILSKFNNIYPISINEVNINSNTQRKMLMY